MATIHQLKVGDFAETSRTITDADIVLFGGVSGDLNPAHFDQVKSSKTMFKTRIAHGILTASYVSAVIGMQLPGPGTIYLSQTLKFLKPVLIGDTITARVEVVELDLEKNRATLKTEAFNQDGKCVLSGEAKVMPPQE